MKIKKGTLVFVNHSRSGKWHGIATKDFDTVKDEWYPLASAEKRSIDGLNTQWFEGEDVPARRGLCKIEVVTNKPKKKLKVSQFGKDHWTLFAYVETRCVDYDGKLDEKHLRRDGRSYPTRLKGYFKNKNNPKFSIENHSDFDCLEDLEKVGFIRIIKNLSNAIELTEEGYKVVSMLRKFKCDGGQYADFSLKGSGKK